MIWNRLLFKLIIRRHSKRERHWIILSKKILLWIRSNWWGLIPKKRKRCFSNLKNWPKREYKQEKEIYSKDNNARRNYLSIKKLEIRKKTKYYLIHKGSVGTKLYSLSRINIKINSMLNTTKQLSRWWKSLKIQEKKSSLRKKKQ